MEYAHEPQKSVIPNGTLYPVIQPIPEADAIKLKRTRKNILIFTGISLGFCLFYAIFTIIGLVTFRAIINRLDFSTLGTGGLDFNNFPPSGFNFSGFDSTEFNFSTLRMDGRDSSLMASNGLDFLSPIMTKNMLIAMQGVQVIEALLWILLYGFGFLVAKKYNRTGLRVFAWLGVINLIFIAFMVVISFIAGIASTLAIKTGPKLEVINVGLIAVAGIFLVLYTACFIITVITVILSFKMVRLIETSDT